MHTKSIQKQWSNMTDMKSKYPEEYSTVDKVGSVFPFKASIQEFLYDREI